jgi:hypothetical protein
VYLDINPLTNKPFYVGIGKNKRCLDRSVRNRFYKKLVATFPDEKFERIILYRGISVEDAYRIEKQIIKRCGRIVDNSGYLTNIHTGGPIEFYSEYGHNYRGKKMEDLYGDDYVNPFQGKPFYFKCDPDKIEEFISNTVAKRNATRVERIKTFGLTEKEINRGKNKTKRIKEAGFTDRELEGFKKGAAKNRGRTMKEATGNPNWVSYKKGKTHKELFGEDYVNPKKGRKYVEPKIKKMSVENYVNPKSEPFKIILNGSDHLFFKSEHDFVSRTKFTNKALQKMRKVGIFVIRRTQINSRHDYNVGDRFEYIPITIEEYKNHIKTSNSGTNHHH